MRIDVLLAHRRLHRGPKSGDWRWHGSIDFARAEGVHNTAIVTVRMMAGLLDGCGGKWGAAAGRYSQLFGGTGR